MDMFGLGRAHFVILVILSMPKFVILVIQVLMMVVRGRSSTLSPEMICQRA